MVDVYVIPTCQPAESQYWMYMRLLYLLFLLSEQKQTYRGSRWGLVQLVALMYATTTPNYLSR